MYIQGGPKITAHFNLHDVKLIYLCDISTKIYNFWQTYTWIDSQQNNACTVHSTYCAFLHYFVEIILSVFCAVSRWNLLMNYVGKQLNSVNHTKLYRWVNKQCSICHPRSWTTRSSRRRHSLMARLMKCRNSLPHSVITAFSSCSTEVNRRRR